MQTKDLEYKGVVELAAKHIEKGRTESAAFLNWFLEEIYRLDDIDADDSICDGNYDQGIDAIYVSDVDQEIVFFQSKLVQNPAKTLGDVALKEFVGSLSQFDSADKIVSMAASTKNPELRKLLERSRIQEKVKAGYKIRGAFVTNANSDQNAWTYLETHPVVSLYDQSRIAEEFVDINAPEGVSGSTTLEVFEGAILMYKSGADATMYQFIAPAADLVSLSGIGDHSLFAQNVRLPLGNTSVNRGIRESLGDKANHSRFPLFHNGITLLCDKASTSSNGQKLTIQNYVVVNGAQTVTTLYKNREKVSQELRLPVRVIELNQKPDLAKTITQISNNQNSIKARDLRANHQIQSRLKSEFGKLYGGEYDYIIKRGETSTAKTVISNEEAGALLLAFDLRRPWSCHQLYRIFEDDYGDVFGRPEVNAQRILFIWTISQVIEEALPSGKEQGFR